LPHDDYLCAVAEIGKDIVFAAKLLREGKLVAIPTETVYGLAANALDEKAVLKIFAVKDRPFFDPLILHVYSFEEAEKYANINDPRLKKLAQHFWPGPLTLLLEKKALVPDLVTSGLPRVAVRVPNHAISLELLKNVKLPLAAPSANPFGYVSPTQAAHVNKQLGGKIDYIIDGGASSVGIESTIVGIEDERLCVYRLGGLALEAIEQVAGEIELRLNISSDPKAPGQLKNHYAPKKPLLIGEISELIKLHPKKTAAIIYYGEEKYNHDKNLSFNLSKTKNNNEAALNLFSCLRAADDSDAEIVFAEYLPEEGLGKAINDRLRRASVH